VEAAREGTSAYVSLKLRASDIMVRSRSGAPTCPARKTDLAG